MSRVLLTGASGFMAAHVLEVLLAHGFSVVATVRSQAKADQIASTHSNLSASKLSFAIVPDMSQPNAFDDAVQQTPPLAAVIHTASPFHYNANTKSEVDSLVTTAKNGTTGVLQSIHKHAPSVKRVVITSSFAALVDPSKPADHTYSEKDWDPITMEESYKNAGSAYRASKTFAERAAWDFWDTHKPNFTVTTCNPPLVLGPVVHHLASLDSINTSNARFVTMLQGKAKDRLPPTGNHLFVDVRDIALAHVLCLEKDEAAGQRFFITAGNFNNRMVCEIIRHKFPEYRDILPVDEDKLKPGDFPADGKYYGYDNEKSKRVLGLEYGGLEKTVVDTVKSLQRIGGV